MQAVLAASWILLFLLPCVHNLPAVVDVAQASHGGDDGGLGAGLGLPSRTGPLLQRLQIRLGRLEQVVQRVESVQQSKYLPPRPEPEASGAAGADSDSVAHTKYLPPPPEHESSGGGVESGAGGQSDDTQAVIGGREKEGELSPNSTSVSPPSPTTSPSTTTTAKSITTNGDPAQQYNILAIVLGTCIPAVVILLGVIIFFFVCKRKKVKFAYRVPSYGKRPSGGRRRRRRLSHRPVSFLEFNSQLHRRLNSGDLEEEFELLQEFSSHLYVTRARRIGQLETNKAKNRFIDILPYDDTLVTLRSESGIPPSSYINASHITGFSSADTFIATQGPKRNTVVDFWNMVLEHNVSVVVCLTNIVEAGRVKCFQYWPPAAEMLHFDELTLFTADEVNTMDGQCVIRKIEVTKENADASTPEQTRTVTQFHLTSWPDHGVPASTKALLDLCTALLGQQQLPAFQAASAATSSGDKRNKKRASPPPPSAPPMVLHCSAGVGRTGTLLAVMLIVKDILAKKASEVDVASVVKHLREQRPKMVQTLDQYVFIYKCIRDFINQTRSPGEVSDESLPPPSPSSFVPSGSLPIGESESNSPRSYENRGLDLESEEK